MPATTGKTGLKRPAKKQLTKQSTTAATVESTMLSPGGTLDPGFESSDDDSQPERVYPREIVRSKERILTQPARKAAAAERAREFDRRVRGAVASEVAVIRQENVGESSGEKTDEDAVGEDMDMDIDDYLPARASSSSFSAAAAASPSSSSSSSSAPASVSFTPAAAAAARNANRTRGRQYSSALEKIQQLQKELAAEKKERKKLEQELSVRGDMVSGLAPAGVIQPAAPAPMSPEEQHRYNVHFSYLRAAKAAGYDVAPAFHYHAPGSVAQAGTVGEAHVQIG